MNGGDFDVLKNPRAAAAGALGERLGDVDGIGIAVARDVDAADDVLEIGERIQRANLARADDVDVSPNTLAMEALRFSSSMRPGVVASDSEPH